MILGVRFVFVAVLCFMIILLFVFCAQLYTVYHVNVANEHQLSFLPALSFGPLLLAEGEKESERKHLLSRTRDKFVVVIVCRSIAILFGITFRNG